MNLYKCKDPTRGIDSDYLCIARSEEEARSLHPKDNNVFWCDAKKSWVDNGVEIAGTHPAKISVYLLYRGVKSDKSIILKEY